MHLDQATNEDAGITTCLSKCIEPYDGKCCEVEVIDIYQMIGHASKPHHLIMELAISSLGSNLNRTQRELSLCQERNCLLPLHQSKAVCF